MGIPTDAAPPAGPSGRIWLDINQPAQVLSWLQIFMDLQSPGHGYGYSIKGIPARDFAVQML